MTESQPQIETGSVTRYAPPQTALSVDIGGGSVRMAIVTRGGEVHAHVVAPLADQGDPKALRETLQRQLTELAGGDKLPEDFVGVAVPGIWDRGTGVMKKAVNLPALEGVNLRELFEDSLQRSALIESDVNAAAWAQWRVIDPLPSRFAYLSLGTGIGGAVILDGQLVRHTNGGAGHFGFYIVDTTDTAARGPNHIPGCLSAVASGPALAAASQVELGRPHTAGKYGPQAADRAARGLAVGILQIVHTYLPDVLVLGGGVVDHHAELVAQTQTEFERRRTMLTPERFRIERATIGTDRAGVIGVALLALARWSGN